MLKWLKRPLRSAWRPSTTAQHSHTVCLVSYPQKCALSSTKPYVTLVLFCGVQVTSRLTCSLGDGPCAGMRLRMRLRLQAAETRNTPMPASLPPCSSSYTAAACVWSCSAHRVCGTACPREIHALHRTCQLIPPMPYDRAENLLNACKSLCCAS